MTGSLLVTGGTGFVGQAVLQRLISIDQRPLVAAVRTNQAYLPAKISVEKIDQIGPDTDWMACLQGVEVVIHCAARAHVMNETAANALKDYRIVNVEGTRNLAEQAIASGVKRFIFLSSIKVNGERTIPNTPFTAEDNSIPEDPYGISKRETEQALHELAKQTGLELVIIRPTLVYGSGVKGNFLSMLGWLNRGIPLPFGSIHNQRSLIGIDNLVDLIITCIEHPAAANQTFLVSDDEDISTTELLRRLGMALDKPACLLPIPVPLLQFGARLLGKAKVAQRLLGNLQVDTSKTREILGWTPPVSVDEGIRKTAEWYLKQ